MAVEIEQHAERAPDQWDAAVEASDDTWLFHTSRWIDTTASVWPLENRYFVARQNGRIVGGFALQVAPGGRRPWVRPRAYSTMMGSGGPFAVGDLAPQGRKNVLKALSEAVVRFGRERRLAAVECCLPPLAQSNLRNIRGVNPMALLGWEDVSTHTRIIDLRVPEADLESDVSRLARRKRKRALADGYTVARADWAESLDDYYEIHLETYRRTGASPHPKAYFEAIARQFAPAGHAVLWVCRTPEGGPAAFYNCARFGSATLSWTACSRTGTGDDGVNYLLLWQAIVGARENGCRYYEVGEGFPNTSDEKLKGLTDFKSKFGGEVYRFYRGRFSWGRC
jgi:hypothetical protein